MVELSWSQITDHRTTYIRWVKFWYNIHIAYTSYLGDLGPSHLHMKNGLMSSVTNTHAPHMHIHTRTQHMHTNASEGYYKRKLISMGPVRCTIIEGDVGMEMERYECSWEKYEMLSWSNEPNRLLNKQRVLTLMLCNQYLKAIEDQHSMNPKGPSKRKTISCP